MMPNYDVRDLALAEAGRERINWAGREMPVLQLIARRFQQERPFKGAHIAGCCT